MKWLRHWRYYRGELPRVAAAVGLMVLAVGANTLKPWPIGLLVDCALGGTPPPSWFPQSVQSWSRESWLIPLALSVLALHGVQGLLQAGQNFASITAGLRALTRVRRELFHWLQRLSIRFYTNSNSGDLIYRVSWDSYAFQTLFQQGLMVFLQSFLLLACMVAVMWSLNPKLALVALSIFPPLLLTMFVFGRKMRQRSLAAHNADSGVTTAIQQAIHLMPLIQSFTRESHEQARFSKKVKTAFASRRDQHQTEIWYWLVIALLFGAGAALMLWFGGREVLRGRLTLGELVIFLSYLTQLYEPLNQLSHVGATVSDASASAQRVFEILDSTEEVPERRDARPAARAGDPNPPHGALLVRGAVEFRGVSFAYNASRDILKDVSFQVEPGESVAIIGPSGAGKSTLLNLLPRFYDPQQGNILLDGAFLRELRLKDLRDQIALVMQEPVLLTGSIAENIGYGLDGATPALVEEAARAANAHDFIRRLPAGYDTQVGDGATRLSVGEKQRISLARAFLKDAPILLLDEPTSALDAENEQLVVESLRSLIRGRTVFMVAHRLSTLNLATKILTIEGGRLTEFGAAAELLGGSGYYNRVAHAHPTHI